MTLPKQLQSRKFWLSTAAFLAALSGFIVSLANGDLNKAFEFLGAMLAAAGLYNVIEGAADIVGRRQLIQKEAAQELAVSIGSDDEPDKQNFTTGE